MRLCREATAEALGTALVVNAVIGSGIMAGHPTDHGGNFILLSVSLAVAATLLVSIEIFGPVSGAHFNPAVSIVLAFLGKLPKAALVPYCVAQCVGAVSGAWLAHAMFELPMLQIATQSRTGIGQWIGEVVATAGLLLVALRAPATRAPALVAAYVGAAVWSTSSTCFANPAVVIGRVFSDTVTGIAPASAPGFILAEALGAVIGLSIHHALRPTPAPYAPETLPGRAKTPAPPQAAASPPPGGAQTTLSQGADSRSAPCRMPTIE